MNKRRTLRKRVLQAATLSMAAGVLVPSAVAEVPQHAFADEGVSTLAEHLMSKAEEQPSSLNVKKAEAAISQLPNGPLQNQLNARLVKLKENTQIQAAENALLQAEKQKREVYITKAQTAIHAIQGPSRGHYQERLDQLVKSIEKAASDKLLADTVKKVDQAERMPRESYFLSAQKAIDALPVNDDMKRLQERLNGIISKAQQAEIDKVVKEAVKRVEQAEKYKRDSYYASAQKAIDALPEGDVKKELQERLKKLTVVGDSGETDKGMKEAIQKVEQAEKNKREAYYKSAQDAINKLGASSEKVALQERLNAVISSTEKAVLQKAIDEVTKKVEQAESNKRSTYIETAHKAVEGLPASSEKSALQKRLATLKTNVEKAEKDKAWASVIAKVEQAEKHKRSTYVETAKKAVAELSAGAEKTALLERLRVLEKQMEQADYDKVWNDAVKKLEQAEKYKRGNYVDIAEKAINDLPASEDKNVLVARLHAVKEWSSEWNLTFEELHKQIKHVESKKELLAMRELIFHSQKFKKEHDVFWFTPSVSQKVTQAQLKQALMQRTQTILENEKLGKSPTGNASPHAVVLDAVEKAEKYQTVSRIRTATKLVEDLADTGVQKELQLRLNALVKTETISPEKENAKPVAKSKAEDAVEKAEQFKTASRVRTATKLVHDMPSGALKTQLQKRVDTVSKQLAK